MRLSRLGTGWHGRAAVLSGLVLALSVVIDRAAAQHPLATLPLSDPAYQQLLSLERQGCGAARVSPFRPFLIGAMRLQLAVAAADSSCDGVLLEALRERFLGGARVLTSNGASTSKLSAGGEITLRATGIGEAEFRPLWRDIRGKSEGTQVAVGIVRARITWAAGERLVAVTEAFGQTGVRNDPRIRARNLRTTSGVLDFDEAYLNGRLGPLVVSVGRTTESWLGEGPESLVLSGNGPPVDRILLDARWTRWEGRALLASIDDVILRPDSDGVGGGGGADRERIHRVLVGHALTYRPTKRLDLTVGETALLSRRGGGLDLAFANPLMPYLVTENDVAGRSGSVDDNNLTVFGAARVTTGALRVAGELFIDDIQIDAADRKRTPDQLGWRVDASAVVPFPVPSSVRLEYERIDGYTYLRRYYNQVYQQYDEPLGSRLGPAADMARLEGELWMSGKLRLAAGGARWRRGAPRIDQRPGLSVVGRQGEPFPPVAPERPVAQRAWLADAAIQWLDGRLPVSASIEAARISAVNNEPTRSANTIRAQIVASYRFRYP